MTTLDMAVPAAGPGDFTPVRSSKSPVKKAGALLAALGILMVGIAFWAAPWVILAWPLVLIPAIAVVFATPLLRTGPPVLIIDETGVYDARIMNRPMPWSDISRVNEKQTGNGTLFVLKTEHWEEWMKRRIFPPERVLLKALDLDGIAISARGLNYSTEGLRDTFAQAKAVGLLKPCPPMPPPSPSPASTCRGPRLGISVMPRYLRVIVSAIYGICGLVTLPLPLLGIMLFDAPGSTSNPLTVMLFVCVACLPVLCAVTTVAINVTDVPFRKIFYFLPIADAIAVAVIVAGIEVLCDGNFVC